jgi:nicotinate-nucleotide adenylyltransferase
MELPDQIAALTEARRVERLPDRPGGAVLVLETPMLPVSASRIRRALAEGDPAVADLLSPAVYTYIKRYHLYGVISDP